MIVNETHREVTRLVITRLRNRHSHTIDGNKLPLIGENLAAAWIDLAHEPAHVVGAVRLIVSKGLVFTKH